MWSDQSSASPPPSPEPGHVINQRTTPAGVVPRHLQQWALVGVAVVMVGIMALSGSPAKPRTTAASSPTGVALDPNQQRIEEYQRRIQEQAQRLAAEQAQLQLTKDAVATSPGGAPLNAPRVDANPRAASAATTADRTSRDDHRRLADNVVFSRASPAESVPFADAASVLTPPMLAAQGVAPGLVGPSAAVPSAPAAVAPPTATQEAPMPIGPPSTLVPVASRTARQMTPSPVTTTASSSGDGPRYRVFEGTLIDTVLTNRLDGTFNGPVNCLVSVPVYASDQPHVVIPAGARVLGEARAVNTFGQSRLAVAFHRVLLPNGTRIDLDGFRGLNQVGDLGLRDHVDRHYAQIFGVSLAIGAIAGFAQAQSAAGLDATGLDVYRQGAATNVSQSSTRILDRFLNLLPTVTIREGHRIKVYLSNDLELQAYRDTFPTPGGRP